MKSIAALSMLLFVLAAMLPRAAEATCTDQTVSAQSSSIIYGGSCTDDNEVLLTTGDMTRYDACMLMSTTGSVDVVASIDGTNYSTAPISLVDMGATNTDPVLATVALRVYAFAAKFLRIRVVQTGATDAAASLRCWAY